MLDRWQMCRDLDSSNHVDHRLPETPQNESIKGIFDMYTENKPYYKQYIWYSTSIPNNVCIILNVHITL